MISLAVAGLLVAMSSNFVRFVLRRFAGHLFAGGVLLLVLVTISFAALWRIGYFRFMEAADLDATFTPTIDTGIFGRVTLYEGNCMQVGSPDFKSCQISHPPLRITVREVATMGDMDRPLDPTHLAHAPPLIASTTADAHGFFEVALPREIYSVLVEDEGREYCNRFSEQGEACVVEVGQAPVQLDLVIDHAAW